MIMNNAGVVLSMPFKDDQQYLYNCTRKVGVQREYFVPVPSLAEVLLYFDFSGIGGKPFLYQIFVVNCDGVETQLVFNNYVIAQKPDNTWYGVFTWIDDAFLNLNLDRFYFKAYITDASSRSYVYFSQQMQFPQGCEVLTRIEACYNDSALGSRTYDVNGTYYGYHAGSGELIGNPKLRYYHYAYVRRCEVVPTKTKFSASLFNNRSFYGNNVTNLYTLQFELVPQFYKKQILAVLTRGNITVNGQMYTLDASQDFTADTDTGFWKLDAVLNEYVIQVFSCTPTVCVVAPPPCTGNFTDVDFVTDGNGYMIATWTGGSLGAGTVVRYTVARNGTIFISGNLSAGQNVVNLNTVYNPYWCYEFEWTMYCAFGGVDTKNKTYCCAITGSGTFDIGECGKAYDSFITLSGADTYEISQVTTAIPGLTAEIANGNQVRLYGTYNGGDCPVVRSFDYTINKCMNFHHAIQFNAVAVVPVVVPKVIKLEAIPRMNDTSAFVRVTTDKPTTIDLKYKIDVVLSWPGGMGGGQLYDLIVYVTIPAGETVSKSDFMMSSDHHLVRRCILQVELGQADISAYKC